MKIASAALDAAIADAVAREPDESCGFLAGRRGRVTTYMPCENGATDPRDDFQIDALEQLRVEDLCREHRLELLGLVHSHPRADATLSTADLTTARNPVLSGWYWLVFSLQDGLHAPRCRAWRVRGDDTEEIYFEIC